MLGIKYVYHITQSTKTELSIEIENVLGQIIYQKTTLAISGKHNESIDLKNAADGIYFLKVRCEKDEISKIIIKQ